MFKDYMLDKSIYFSFDRTGYKRHSKGFSNSYLKSLSGKTVIVTGGTSGIGESLVETLKENGGNALFTGRTLKNIDLKESFHSLDMNSHQDVIKLAEELPALDAVVLNAGGMPEEYVEFNGYENQFSSQLLGHYVLLRKLIDLKKLGQQAKVIWMSSGGMYLSKYDPGLITNSASKYDKVAYYANVKRAQIIVNDFLASEFKDSCITFCVMHPGWVDTYGVRSSIPGFFEFTKKRLRTPAQGADTAAWLIGEEGIPSGEFWFDRKQQRKVVFPWTKNTDQERETLYHLCEDYYQSICQN